MNLSNAARSLGPSLDLPVLAVLARQGRSWTTREVADATGATVPGVRQALDRLSRHGLVRVERLGRIRGYSLNEEHVLVDGLRSVLDAPAALRRRIVAEVQGWPVPALAVVLFGSWARGAAGEDSDVDLFLVHDTLDDDGLAAWEVQTDRLRQQVRAWSGNGCDVLAFDVVDWRAHVDRGDPLVAGVQRDAVMLLGPRSLLTGETRRSAVTA